MRYSNYIVIFLISMGILYFCQSCSDGAKVIEFKNIQLEYSAGINDSVIDKLRKYLTKDPCSCDSVSKQFQLTKGNGTYLFKISIVDYIAEKNSDFDLCKHYARQLSKDVFDGKKVEIHICDGEFETKHIVRPFELK